MPGAPLPGSSRIRFRIRGHFGPAFRPAVSSRGPFPNRAVSGPHLQRALSLSAPLGAARDSAPFRGPANPQPPVFSRSGRVPPLAPLRGHRLSDLPNPGIEPRSPALQADSLPAGPPRKRTR
ncbi:zinc finger protein 596 isoform X5 [Odocoileus virginianus]|uniref:Zinc finger protein 596 isoform X5 n=1 Tax=Odocoileus virginianus TaxID=9874 RepID=A0ABM4I5T3_ODOVR